jgi:cyclic pyranopterin phosphate synthase
MPAEGAPIKPHSEILKLEDIASIVREAAQLGFTKIKLTGGEPLIRRNLEFLIHEIAETPGITDLGMTTNASLLTHEKARALKQAGLMRVNISLDTLDASRFSSITRLGNIQDVLTGIDAAIEAELTPVKINMVIFEDTSESEITSMMEFCGAKGIKLQTISHFSLHERNGKKFLEADRPPHCHECNRLRLTADGNFKSCLFSDREIKVNLNNIKQSISDAVNEKPECGHSCETRGMSQIGG